MDGYDDYLEEEEDQREIIAADIAEHMNCPLDAVMDGQIDEWQKRGWSVHENRPYCLFCGTGIKSELESMPQRKFCGSCRSSLN